MTAHPFTAEDRRQAVEEVIRAQFGLSQDFALTDGMGPGDIPGWDSLNWIELLSAVEERFGIEIDLDRSAQLDTVGRIKDAAGGRTAPGPLP